MPINLQSKTILNKTKKRDEWFLDDYTLNPYSGCSFNCLYCYIRGSKYGINMEDKLAVKTNAPELLEKQLNLRAKKNQFGYVVMSSATDPYLQFEDELGLTRALLEILLRYRFPVHIVTKSHLVERDFDLLKAIDEQAILPDDLKSKPGRGALITFSFSTLNDTVRSIFEPGATPIQQRLKVLADAAKYGFKTGVSLMPLLPYISDEPKVLEEMYHTFKKVGSHYIMPASTTLFGFNSSDSKSLVMRAITKYFPDLIEKYNELYGFGYTVPHAYQKWLKTITDDLSQKFEMPLKINY